MRVDICMTAALRPDIVVQTLESLKKNINLMVSAAFFHSLRLVVDIANVGDPQYTQQDVLDAIHQTVPGWDVIARALPEGSVQAEALRWTWKTSDAPCILQWEDDWTLEKEVSMQVLLRAFLSFKRLGMLYLDRAGKSVLDYGGYSKGTFEKVGNGFYRRKKGKSLGGPPAVLSRQYINAVMPLLDGVTCLDVLSQGKKAQKVLSNWELFVFTGLDNKGNLVQDIGKEWRAKRGLKMVKNTERGVTWKPEK